METLKKKIVDWVEAFLAPILGIAYFLQISEVLTYGKYMLATGVEHVTLWCQYSLPRLVRPFYSLAVILTVSTWTLGSILFWFMAPKDAGTWPYWLWTGFDAVLLVTFIVYWALLGSVRPMSEADVVRLKLLADPDKAAARRARVSEFGDGRVMTPSALGLALLAPLIIGAGLWVMASLSNLAGSHWVLTVQFILMGLLSGFVSLFLVMLAAVTLGTTVRAAGELFIGLFKGGWDSILTTFLPNIEGEEAKELLPKDLGKHVAAAWKLFTSVVLSVPGVIALAMLALAIVWHYPLILTILSAAFIGLTMSTLSSIQLGNDETPARKRAGKIISWFFIGGFLYRLAELWRFGLPHGGTWYWEIGEFTVLLAHGWNGFVPWWNGLVRMTWWQDILVVVVLAIGISQILKLPDSKWMSRIKYGLVTILGVGVVIVAVGFIANRASINAVAHTVPLAPTSTGTVVVAAVAQPRAPDAIDRLRAGTVVTPVIVVVPVEAAPPPAPTVRPRERARASSVPVDMCDRIAHARDLTDEFREHMLSRHHCGS